MSVSNFAEIRSIIAHLPAANTQAVEDCRRREVQLTKPAGSLGRLEEISEWYAAWGSGSMIGHPRLAVFAGNHGVARQGVSAFPQEVTAQMVANFTSGGACINQLCGLHGMDLQVYELNLQQPTEDFSQVPAMSEEDSCLAMAYGMSSVAEGVDFLCLGEMGIGNTAVSAALNYSLFGGSAEDWVGSGTGVEGSALRKKIDIVEQSVVRHRGAMVRSDGRGVDALQVLRHVGGFEFAAMIGAILAARMGGVPVLLDGYVCSSAAAVLHVLGQELGVDLLAHCLVGHLSSEFAHGRLCEILGKRPLLDLGLRLGEGSGAVLAYGVVKGALACHFGMATFGEAGVSDKG